MNIRKYLTAAALLSLMLVLAACTPEAKNEEAVRGPLVYGSSEITSINPVLYEHGEINALIFSGLMKHGKKNVPEPHLAESYTVSEDYKIFDFTLRKDVLWHDGEPFTAADVKFTLEAIMAEENGSEIASNYEDIEDISILSDHQVRISLSSPNVAMLDYLTIGMVPKHLLEGKDLSTDDFNRHPIGTGPYKVKDFTLGEAVTLAANETYFKGEPGVESIVFKFVSDSKTRALQLKAGELDLALLSPVDAEQFKDSETLKVAAMTTADYRGILYNFGSDFFSRHRELPNILSYGIERQAMVDSVLLGYGEAAYSPLQRSAFVKEDMEKFSYSPEKVKEGLVSHGWTLGADRIYEKEGERLSFTLNCMEGDETRVDLARVAAQQLKGLGVEVKVNIAADIDWEKQEAFLIGWGSPLDPDDHTYKVFGSDKGSNYSGYTNTKVDEALTRARQTGDAVERKAYYEAFQDELTKDMPYTFLAYIDALYVISEEIEGLDMETVLGHHGVGLFRNVDEWSWKQP